MKKNKIHSYWYKVTADFTVISQSESSDFDPAPGPDYILWIEKTGPHGFFPTPDIYDDPIYHFQLFDQNKAPIKQFHIHNGWYLAGISTIEQFRESYYQQFHIQDPVGIIKTRKIWSFTAYELSEHFQFMRDELGSFESWEAYEQAQ